MIIDKDQDRIGEWVSSRGLSWFSGCTGIGVEKNGELVGAVVFDNWNKSQVFIHCTSDLTKKWLTREFLWFVFYYAFEQLGAKRLTAPISDKNKSAQKFIENIGFEKEATLEEAHPDGDLILYKMMKKDCRWIKRRKYGK